MGCFDQSVCIRVEGRATFQNSTGLKALVREMIQRGHRDFIVDLHGCDLMDSTFMGTLAGAALRLREIGHGHLKVVRASERNRDLLLGLGLDQLFDVHSDSGGVGFLMAVPTRMTAETATDRDQKETVLEAHEALAEADQANAEKFRDVIEFLRQEGRTGGEDGTSET